MLSVQETVRSFPTVLVSFYIPFNNVCEFQLLHILTPTSGIANLFCFSHCGICIVGQVIFKSTHFCTFCVDLINYPILVADCCKIITGNAEHGEE